MDDELRDEIRELIESTIKENLSLWSYHENDCSLEWDDIKFQTTSLNIHNGD
tara:strand:+ start:143 stop:298 length:156 start_codon:yes stop_codon:yes gene_type:complete